MQCKAPITMSYLLRVKPGFEPHLFKKKTNAGLIWAKAHVNDLRKEMRFEQPMGIGFSSV